MAQTQRIGKTATKVIEKVEGISVIYHQTTVVWFNLAKIVLDTGGWFTLTTKTRMNQASNQYGLDYHVRQVKGQWFCEFKGQAIKFEGDTLTLTR